MMGTFESAPLRGSIQEEVKISPRISNVNKQIVEKIVEGKKSLSDLLAEDAKKKK